MFIDGCFWHGCEAHYTTPKSNASYWSEKVERNRQRDLETSALLGLADEDPYDITTQPQTTNTAKHILITTGTLTH